jgi:hypothetical protein
MRRGLFLSGLLCLSLSGVLAARQSATEVKTKPWEKLLGTWKKVPGPDDPTTLKVEPVGGGIKMSFGCRQDGSCPDIITVSYDGKPYKEAGNPTWEASFRKADTQTMQEDGYSSGKPSTKVMWQLSPDGKTLTRTYRYINPTGSKDVAFAYDRSGGPVSKNDPFIGFWKLNWNKSDVLLTTVALKGDMLTIMEWGGITIERNCDGKDHPEITEVNTVYSCRITDPFTYELVLRQNEKVTFSLTRKISDDGKKMAVIRKNALGKTMPELTFERVK